MSDNQEWMPEAQETSSGGSSRYDRVKDWDEVQRKVGRKSVTFYERRARIVGPGIGGLVAWDTDNRPHRFRNAKEIPADFKFRDNKFQPGKKETPSEFIAYPAWCYPDFKVIEMAKWGLVSGFRRTFEKWGRPDAYDIVLTKGEDEKGKVVYFCDVFVPEDGAVKHEMPAEAKQAYAEAVAAGFDIARLIGGGDPFSPPGAAPATSSGQESVPF